VKPANSVMSGYGTTVFEVMSRLAMEHGSINLGQGFPDGNGPPEVVAAAQASLADRPNQYPPMMGAPELRQAVARHEKRFHGLEVDWQTEVMVTSGATEGLAACLFGLIEPGDEVVLFEPLYDSYLPIIRRAGGIPKLVRLSPPDWALDEAALRAAFSDRTKLILLNNPLNPAAKVFTRAELDLIASLVIQHDAVAVCDEVYEHIVFDDAPAFIPLITLPGMRERCLRLGSAGKTFSLTGWKVGYVTAAPDLLRAVTKAHQFLVFTTPPNLQRAVAAGLDLGDAYYWGLIDEMQAKRDRFARGLQRIGFAVLPSQGTYFVSGGFRPLGFKGTDEEFCRHITVEAKVTAVPVSAFFTADGPQDFARFCFCKKDEVLDAALDRLARHFGA
jgi:N-succinyldiaminopimelate aminotransferase